MGTKNSSSKPKSSKRKPSKISSQARKKKKIRGSKSKKLHRRDDSVSSYCDDDSRSLMSNSSSSSHEHHRRARSRLRSDAKGSKKRARSSSSGDSSEYSRHVKKRKGSRKSRNTEVRKKTRKKKHIRDASISPTSSDTNSCSTSKGGNGNSNRSGENEFARSRSKLRESKKAKRDGPRGRSRESKKAKKDELRGRSRESKKDERDSRRGRSRESKKDEGDLGKPSATRNRKNRSQSRSSCSRSSDSSGYTIKEDLAGGNDSRRLRSVVIVAKQPQDEEETFLDKSGHKEEVVYDHDDYPSCRSNDSDDGGSKRDSFHHAHDASEKRSVEAVKGEEAFISNDSSIGLTDSGKDGGGQHDDSICRSDGVGANNPSEENKSESSAVVSGSNVMDLETILRQKALENLRKFRKVPHTDVRTLPDQKMTSDSDVKQPSTAKAEFVQTKSPKWVDFRVVGAPKVVTRSTKPMTWIKPSSPIRIDRKISEGKHSRIEPGTTKSSAACPPDRGTVSGNPKEKDPLGTDAGFNKFGPGRSALRQETSGTCPTIKQTLTSQASPKLVTDSGVNKRRDEASQTIVNPSGTDAGFNKSGPGRSVLRQETLSTCSTIKHAPSSQASPKLVTDSGVNKRRDEASQTIVNTNINNGNEVSTVPENSSGLKPTSEEHSSKEGQNEVKDNSQYEQKTMSVMRGGEMVQVNYKVYIPKKAPALARRKLRRPGSDV